MKKHHLLFALLGMSLTAACASEPLKVWSYESQAELSRLTFGCEAPGSLSHSPDPSTKTPDGQTSLKLTLKDMRAESAPWTLQALFRYEGGLKAGDTYEMEFYCKGSSLGELSVGASLFERPWTPLSPPSPCAVTTDWRKLSVRFTADKDYSMPLASPHLMLARYGTDVTLHLGPITLRRIPKPLPLSLNHEWRLLLGRPGLKDFSAIPADAQTTPVTLTGNTVDIAKLAGGFKERDCAILYNQFTCEREAIMRLGIAADYWFRLFVNGKEVYNTSTTGNVSPAYVPDDHVVDIPVNAGGNLLAVEVLSGSKGWAFVCGTPTRAPDSLGLLTIAQGQNWKPIDMDRLRVKAGSPLDFSCLANEKRQAGASGRVIAARDGHFAFEKEPDRPVRFLGFNACNFAPGVEATKAKLKEDAEETARRGYNLRRLQFIDYVLVGAHKLKGGDFQKALDKSVSFDDESLDLFDFFLASLKANGVYFNLDLMSSSTGYAKIQAWLPAEPGKSFKTQLLFNQDYRRHWAEAITKLMNHRNPYTGSQLKDEAALLCVEPFNEQDILLFDSASMKELAPHFKDYLKAKYGTDAALAKAWNQADISFSRVPDIDEKIFNKGDAQAEDAGLFLIKTMSDTTDWYFKILRDAGYQGLVTQWDMIVRTLEMPVRAKMPIIAQHCYFAHPGEVPSKKLVGKSRWNRAWEMDKDIVVGQGSSLNSSFFRAPSASRFLGRPFMITEYSQSYFNRYRHERGLYFASYAALQGWDGLISHGSTVLRVREAEEPLRGFEDAKDPVSRASEVIATLAWFRGDVKEAPHTVQLNLSNETLFPKHFLAAMGDDYAKLAMLTRLGVVYPEIKPLMPVGKAKTDLELIPEEFSDMHIRQWYASASANDGKLFPSLVQTLRDKHIMPGENKTDYSKRLYQSETGEITLDGKNETMTVVTPRLEGAIIKTNVPVKLGRMEINSCAKPASVVLASLDRDRIIAQSAHLLLIFSTNALNSGMTFENPSMTTMVEAGSLPVLMETAKLSLTLRSAQTTVPAVYALSLDGARAEQVPCEFKDGALSLALDTGKLKYATPFFEIAFP